jgi:predicted ABC-type ATPase
MEPSEDSARCPTCGRIDSGAVIRPLLIVTGASGSGKTSVFTPLARRLSGRCMTFDVDWLLDAAGQLSHANSVEDIDSSAFRSAWFSVAHGVAQCGMPTLLLGPLISEHLEGLSARKWVGEIHFLLLDCPDDFRRERLVARLQWRSRDIEAHTSFGRWLRANIDPRVDTNKCAPEDSADAVARWVFGRI